MGVDVRGCLEQRETSRIKDSQLSQAQLYSASLASSVCMFGWAEAAETKAKSVNYKCTKLAYDGLRRHILVAASAMYA